MSDKLEKKLKDLQKDYDDCLTDRARIYHLGNRRLKLATTAMEEAQAIITGDDGNDYSNRILDLLSSTLTKIRNLTYDKI